MLFIIQVEETTEKDQLGLDSLTNLFNYFLSLCLFFFHHDKETV